MTLSKKLLEVMKKSGIQVLTENINFKRRSTGIIALDYALGGGLIEGGMTTLSGFPAYGKSLLLSLICKNIVNADGGAAIMDTERSMTRAWLNELGEGAELIDLISGDKRTTGEQFLDLLTQMIAENSHDVIGYDGIAATTFSAEKAASMSDTPFAIGARKWGEFCRKIKAILADSDVCLLMTNHDRNQIDKYAPDIGYGGRWIGGFTPDCKMKMLSPKKPDEGSGDPLILRVNVTKNKGLRHKRMAIITLYPDGEGGFIEDPTPALVEVGKKIGVFTFEGGVPIKGGGTWYFGEEKLVSGEEKVKAMINQDQDLRVRVYNAVYDRMYQSPAESLTNDNEYDGADESSENVD